MNVHLDSHADPATYSSNVRDIIALEGCVCELKKSYLVKWTRVVTCTTSLLAPTRSRIDAGPSAVLISENQRHEARELLTLSI